MVNSHMWLVATILKDRACHCRNPARADLGDDVILLFEKRRKFASLAIWHDYLLVNYVNYALPCRSLFALTVVKLASQTQSFMCPLVLVISPLHFSLHVNSRGLIICVFSILCHHKTYKEIDLPTRINGKNNNMMLSLLGTLMCPGARDWLDKDRSMLHTSDRGWNDPETRLGGECDCLCKETAGFKSNTRLVS